MAEGFHGVGVTRVRAGVRTDDRDRAATEEPLEVRLHGRPFAVIMRTPGADRELAAGFLLSEGVLKSADDLGTIEYCAQHGPAKAGHYDSTQARRDDREAERDDQARRPENIVNVTL